MTTIAMTILFYISMLYFTAAYASLILQLIELLIYTVRSFIFIPTRLIYELFSKPVQELIDNVVDNQRYKTASVRMLLFYYETSKFLIELLIKKRRTCSIQTEYSFLFRFKKLEFFPQTNRSHYPLLVIAHELIITPFLLIVNALVGTASILKALSMTIYHDCKDFLTFLASMPRSVLKKFSNFRRKKQPTPETFHNNRNRQPSVTDGLKRNPTGYEGGYSPTQGRSFKA
jgi:hypothetical protein